MHFSNSVLNYSVLQPIDHLLNANCFEGKMKIAHKRLRQSAQELPVKPLSANNLVQ
jgi:hypothetical protein